MGCGSREVNPHAFQRQMGAPFRAGAAALVESSSNEHLLVEQTTEGNLTVWCYSHVGT